MMHASSFEEAAKLFCAASERHSRESCLEQAVNNDLNPLLTKTARRELQHNVEANAEQKRRPAQVTLLQDTAEDRKWLYSIVWILHTAGIGEIKCSAKWCYP